MDTNPIAQTRSPSIVAKLFYAASMLAAVAGGLFGFFTVSTATGAPQEAAGAAIACLIVIAPYVFARGIDAITR
jgi:hypothetical protein